jgi:hypothetical protein
MSQIFDEEMENQPQAGMGQIVAACLCLGLSLLCGLFWVSLLLWPGMLKAIT